MMLNRHDAVLDLRGEVCPHTYVRTKLALEDLSPGRVLLVVLDHPPAFLRIPRSAAEDGHRILDRTDRNDGTFEVLIEKGDDS